MALRGTYTLCTNYCAATTLPVYTDVDGELLHQCHEQMWQYQPQLHDHIFFTQPSFPYSE